MLQTPRVGELLGSTGYEAVRHGVFIVGFIVQCAQQACCACKVPTTHIEPTDIELHIAVQAEVCVGYYGQYVQLAVDANIAQFNGQHWLQMAIDADLLKE